MKYLVVFKFDTYLNIHIFYFFFVQSKPLKLILLFKFNNYSTF